MNEYIKNEVFKYRNDCNLTQEDLAKKIGVSRQTIVSIEKGRYTPSVLLAIKIANVFKLPVEKIFFIKYEK